ncbi:MAG: hypothetical protein WC770_09755 [Phycisphaerae bacterium]|jgi:hypothetical protein
MRAKVNAKMYNETGAYEQMCRNISKFRRGMRTVKGDETPLNADVEGADVRLARLKDIFTKYLR